MSSENAVATLRDLRDRLTVAIALIERGDLGGCLEELSEAESQLRSAGEELHG